MVIGEDKFPERIGNWLRTSKHIPGVLLFLVNLVLLLPAFLPTLSELGVWDQPAYITSGQRLLDNGILPSFAGNPLTSAFYALTYLPFRSSPLWMVHSCSLGRIILFSLLWIALYLIGQELASRIPPLLLPGILLVTPLAVEVMTYPSDPLFAGLAGLCFWQFLRYINKRELRSLGLASMFLGLAALARNDGIVLFPIAIVLTLLLHWRDPQWKRALVSITLPFGILVGGYILVYGLITGTYSMGTAARTYENFESGHQLLLNASGDINRVIESRIQAREVFGTPEENNYNVFRAILRNPSVYLLRVRLLLPNLASALLAAYGKRFTPILMLLAIQGIVVLARDKDWPRLFLFLLWPAHLLTGFLITIFRPGHLTFVYFIVYGLASIGLAQLIETPPRWRNRYLWTGILVCLTVYGLLDNKLAFVYAAVVFFLALLIISIMQLKETSYTNVAALLILAAAGIILRQGYPSPRLRDLGSSEAEQAVIFMSEELPDNSLVAAGSPGYIQAARMTYFGLASTDIPFENPSPAFISWMQDQGVQYLFADYSLWSENSRVWEKLEPALGHALIEIFASSGGDIRIYELQP